MRTVSSSRVDRRQFLSTGGASLLAVALVPVGAAQGAVQEGAPSLSVWDGGTAPEGAIPFQFVVSEGTRDLPRMEDRRLVAERPEGWPVTFPIPGHDGMALSLESLTMGPHGALTLQPKANPKPVLAVTAAGYLRPSAAPGEPTVTLVLACEIGLLDDRGRVSSRVMTRVACTNATMAIGHPLVWPWKVRELVDANWGAIRAARRPVPAYIALGIVG
jgi:hypothetical protein